MKGYRDPYKVEQINMILGAADFYAYLSGDYKTSGAKAINLDGEVLELAKAYYEGKKITVEAEEADSNKEIIFNNAAEIGEYEEMTKPLDREVVQEPIYCPKFRNHLEKYRVFHTVTAVEKFFSVIGKNDAIDDISVLKELVRKIEAEE